MIRKLFYATTFLEWISTFPDVAFFVTSPTLGAERVAYFCVPTSIAIARYVISDNWGLIISRKDEHTIAQSIWSEN